MSGRIEVIGNATLYLGDCRDILPTLPPRRKGNGGKAGKTFAQFPFAAAVSEVLNG